MKKNLITAILFAIFCAVACSKKTDDVIQNPVTTVRQDPTMKIDSTYPSKTIIVPKIDTVISSIVLDTKDALGMTAVGSSIRFVFTGAFKPSDDLRNVYFVVKDADTTVFTSEKKLTLNDAVNSFTQNAFLGFIPAKIYLIQLHADVLSSATDNADVNDQCTVIFDLIYQSNGSSVNKKLSVTGQTLTFSGAPIVPVSNLQTLVDLGTPGADTITGLQEIELLRVKLKSSDGNSIITNQSFLVSDANASVIVSTLKVYDGSTLVGSGSVSNGSVLIPMNFNLLKDSSKSFSVKAVVGIVGVNSSGASLKVTLDGVTYKDPTGVIKNNDTNRVGNSFVLLKAKQIITSLALSGNLPNGSLIDVNKVSILSIGGNTATKQLTYKVNLIDNATHVDSLSLKNLYFKIRGNIVNAKFTNSAGQIIDSVGPGDGIVRVTFAVSGFHEYINPEGLSIEYVLGGRFTGFNHQAQDGDIGTVELLANDNPTNYKIVNSGVAPNNISAKLFDLQAGNSSAVVQNYAWSDISAGVAHSFAFGSGSPDAKNASIGVTFNTNTQVWSRR